MPDTSKKSLAEYCALIERAKAGRAVTKAELAAALDALSVVVQAEMAGAIERAVAGLPDAQAGAIRAEVGLAADLMEADIHSRLKTAGLV